MTDPDQKPVISDAEVDAFYASLRQDEAILRQCEGIERADITEALSAFLKARVPPEKFKHPKLHESDFMEAHGFNACRDVVMKGRGA